jgi:endonuclease/exonuclease/phosphatase (EEP) superfamily protein YafD
MPSSPSDSPSPLRLPALATRLAALATLAIPLSLYPAYPLTLLEHFRLQLLFGAAVVVLFAAALRVALWFDLASCNTVLAFVLVAPALAPAPPPVSTEGVRVRVLLSNVLTSNRDLDGLGALVAETSPDLIALLEPNATWFARLRPMLRDYPSKIEIDNEANFGIALYARAPMRAALELLGSRQPSVVASVALAGAAPLSVILTHPVPPITAESEGIHRRHLAAVAERATTLPRPLLVLGDLNTTPWASTFAQLVRRSGLRDTRAGFGVQATYPTRPRWMAPLRIPIDHALVSEDIVVLDRRVAGDLGSDHFPVVLDLVVPAR